MLGWFGQKKTPILLRTRNSNDDENKNEGSHFYPLLKHSFRIYKEIFHLALSSILSFASRLHPLRLSNLYRRTTRDQVTWSQG